MLSMPQKLLCAVTLWTLSPIAEGRYHDDCHLADTEGLSMQSHTTDERWRESHSGDNASGLTLDWIIRRKFMS